MAWSQIISVMAFKTKSVMAPRKNKVFCEFSQKIIGINHPLPHLFWEVPNSKMENIEKFWAVELRGEDMCLIVFGHPGDCTMLCPYFLDMT
jgi:hypothetical protein